jgi:hypothetical protein
VRELENQEKHARQSIECYKQRLMANCGGRSEDQNANKIVYIKDCTHEMVSDGKKGSIGSWTRGHSSYILAKNFSTFCPEFKGNGWINLAEVFSNPVFKMWHGYFWLL